MWWCYTRSAVYCDVQHLVCAGCSCYWIVVDTCNNCVVLYRPASLSLHILPSFWRPYDLYSAASIDYTCFSWQLLAGYKTCLAQFFSPIHSYFLKRCNSLELLTPLRYTLFAHFIKNSY